MIRLRFDFALLTAAVLACFAAPSSAAAPASPAATPMVAIAAALPAPAVQIRPSSGSRPSGGARPSSGGGIRPSSGGGIRPSGGSIRPSGGSVIGSRPAVTPSRPSATPSRPTFTPSRPTVTPSRPTVAPTRPTIVQPSPRPSLPDRTPGGIGSQPTSGSGARPVEPGPGSNRTGYAPAPTIDLPPNVIQVQPSRTDRIPVPRFYQPGSTASGNRPLGRIGAGPLPGSNAGRYRDATPSRELAGVAARRSLDSLVQRYGRGVQPTVSTSAAETRAALERIARRRETMPARDRSRLDYARGPIDRLARPDARPASTQTADAPARPVDRTGGNLALDRPDTPTLSRPPARIDQLSPERQRQLLGAGRVLGDAQANLIATGVGTVGGRPLAEALRRRLSGGEVTRVRPTDLDGKRRGDRSSRRGADDAPDGTSVGGGADVGSPERQRRNGDTFAGDLRPVTPATPGGDDGGGDGGGTPPGGDDGYGDDNGSKYGYWGPGGYPGYGTGFGGYYNPYWTACNPGWYWGFNYGGFCNPFSWGWYGISNCWYWGWNSWYPNYFGVPFGSYAGYGVGGFSYPLLYSNAIYATQEPVQVVIYNDTQAPAANVQYVEAAPEAGPEFDPNAAGMADTTFADQPGEDGALALSADRYLTLGDRAFREGSWTEAAEYYTKATEIEPEVGVLYLVLADALFAAGDYGHSAVALRRAFALEPELARSTVDKREFYADAADFDRQLETARRFVEDHPADADARLTLAVNELFGNDPEAAGDTLAAGADALATDPAAAVLRGAISARR